MRINTNGLGSLINGEDIAPKLAGLVVERGSTDCFERILCYSQERLIYLQFAEKNAGPESKKYDNLYKWPIINLKLKRRIDNFE